ncbi:hypothetical protein SGPA1_90059 [Streptomyces misionensis JCM 4497]
MAARRTGHTTRTRTVGDRAVRCSLGRSQTSLLMAVGRSPRTGRGREGLRRTALRTRGHASVLFSGTRMSAAAQTSRTHLDPNPRSSSQ